jgi:peptide chain release factor 3
MISSLPAHPTPTGTSESDRKLAREVARRRTFAIIAHPDAGKTTLTEKLLLYSGRINEAGAVRGRKTQRAARSDWMKMEQERGVSVTSTCLAFDYQGFRINLLDTPGHQDFSEDTYRTLTAVDAAVMVLDGVRGVEPQTVKLFKICAERQIPILTFVNKMDRPGADPLQALTAIEEVLGIDAIPLNWPIGTGYDFRGLVDRTESKVLKFSPVPKGSLAVPVEESDLAGESHPFPSEVLAPVLEEIELLDGAAVPFDQDQFLHGQQTPVFFGCALNNFGVEVFLRQFLRLAPPPVSRESEAGPVDPHAPDFTGVVFKIQANLDPRHRDRIAFVRVCSGRFERDMEVQVARTGEKIRIRRSHQLFAQERELTEEAFPGDVIGMVNPGKLRLGDTLCSGPPRQYVARWEYPPECFARIRCKETGKRKQFSRGLQQLIEEGAVQMLSDSGTSSNEPVLAAVGELQFDVVQFRLESEYNAQTVLERLPYDVSRWVHNPGFDPEQFHLPSGTRIMYDHAGAPMLLFQDDWSLQFCQSRNPDLILAETRSPSPVPVAAAT